MSRKEITSKIIELLKAVDEKDYQGLVGMFGSEKVCKEYIQNSLKHPDMIISLLAGTRSKSKNETINAEIDRLISTINK